MVKHVAHLVRIGITDDEAQAFSQQVSAIIDYFRLLNEVDTSDVPSAAEITNTRNVMREDQVTPSMSREEFLNNTPRREGGLVKVPSVLSEE